MKHYIGVKIIQADPEDRDGKPGYKVAYPDGYISWRPADVFEAAYLPLANPTRITPAEVDAFLGEVGSEQISPKTTLVKAKTLTGFEQFEVSSCVNPANYDHELGTKIGTERIKNTLWLCLGFVLQWGQFGLKGNGNSE